MDSPGIHLAKYKPSSRSHSCRISRGVFQPHEVPNNMTRRQLLAASAALPLAAQSDTTQKKQRKGRLKQGVCGSVFGRGMSFEDQCKQASRLGVQVIDLVE